MKKLRISCLIVFLVGVLVGGAGLSLMLLEVSAFRYGGEKLIEGQSSDIKTYREAVDLSALDTLEIGVNGYIPHYCYRDADLLLVTDAAAGDEAIVEVRYNSAFYKPLVEVEIEREDEYAEDNNGEYDGDNDGEYDEDNNGEDGEGDNDDDQADSESGQTDSESGQTDSESGQTDSESGQSDPPQETPAPALVSQPQRATLSFYTARHNELAEFMMLKDAMLQDFKERTLYEYDLKKVYEVKITVSPENVEKIMGLTPRV